MHRPHAPMIVLPDELCDQAVAQLVETLYEIAHALEDHYAGQLHRYRFAVDERQQDLWPENGDDTPF